MIRRMRKWRVFRATLAAILALTLVFALFGSALAWNGSTWVSGWVSGGSTGAYAVAHIFIGGGTDSYDYVCIDLSTDTGTRQWCGGLNFGNYNITTGNFWIQPGHYATGFTVWWYDSVYGPNCYLTQLS